MSKVYPVKKVAIGAGVGAAFDGGKETVVGALSLLKPGHQYDFLKGPKPPLN